jgi:hypothetical protein
MHAHGPLSAGLPSAARREDDERPFAVWAKLIHHRDEPDGVFLSDRNNVGRERYRASAPFSALDPRPLTLYPLDPV